MQQSFDFVASDIARWRDRLVPVTERGPLPRRRPVGQLIKSLISGRTRDAVSLAAYHRLRDRFGSAAAIAGAPPASIEQAIADVTFPDIKAGWLAATLRRIQSERPDFNLDFLGALPLETALAWLERLPGVGRKVAASALNASTLAMPVLIVDSHVHRVLARLGFITPGAEAQVASEKATAARPDWDADDFLHFHIAMKRLGQTACRFEAPDCTACALAVDCPSRHD